MSANKQPITTTTTIFEEYTYFLKSFRAYCSAFEHKNFFFYVNFSISFEFVTLSNYDEIHF
jgi:hypothetical protein